MALPRQVEPEMLDGLAETDPAAVRSRRDLQRIHRLMGTRGITTRALRTLAGAVPASRPLRVLELGAGDGSLLLRVARSGAVRPGPHGVELVLLDRQNLVGPDTIARYREHGWVVRMQQADVADWVAGAGALPVPEQPSVRWDVVVAHLFLHHFDAAPLAGLLAAVAARSHAFFACEPRRGWLALAGSHLVGLVGANAVTREDAVLSVHAGFRGSELALLWPPGSGWHLQEGAAGLFSHVLQARRPAGGGAGASGP